jgi:hypothetical protein
MSVDIDKLKKQFESDKRLKLFFAVLIDLLGFLSYVIPGFLEFSDVGIAPISAILVYVLFKKKLKWATFTFLEELLPFTDIIPSATIAWYDIYVSNQEKTIKEMIEAETKKEEAFLKYSGENNNNILPK